LACGKPSSVLRFLTDQIGGQRGPLPGGDKTVFGRRLIPEPLPAMAVTAVVTHARCSLRTGSSARGVAGGGRGRLGAVGNPDVTSTMLLVALALVSGLSFLYYGFRVLFQPALKGEFQRYGMPAFRTLVGVMEVLGGTAVLIGLAIPALGAFAAGGLTVMMILGLIVRFRVHDPVRLMVPAAVLGALNAVLVVLFATQ